MTIPSSAWEDSYRAQERVREKKGKDRENSSTCWPIDKSYYYRPSKITRSASHQITPYKNSNVNATSRNRACSYCAPRFRNGNCSRVPRERTGSVRSHTSFVCTATKRFFVPSLYGVSLNYHAKF